MASSPSDLLQLVSSPLPFNMKNKLLHVIITTYLGTMHKSKLITELTWTLLPLCHCYHPKFHSYIHCMNPNTSYQDIGRSSDTMANDATNSLSNSYHRIWSSLSRTWGNLNFKIVERAKAYVFFWIEDTLSTWNQIQILINKKATQLGLHEATSISAYKPNQRT